jgi:hypothetical protein
MGALAGVEVARGTEAVREVIGSKLRKIKAVVYERASLTKTDLSAIYKCVGRSNCSAKKSEGIASVSRHTMEKS